MSGSNVREIREDSTLVKVVKLHQLATFETAYDTDIGFDLTCVDYTLVNDLMQIRLGVAVVPPRNVWFMLVPRSSFPMKHGMFLANGVGIIDPDYRGEWIMYCQHLDPRGFDDRKLGVHLIGHRVAQAIPMNTAFIKHEIVEDLNETERGKGGFGSTD